MKVSEEIKRLSTLICNHIKSRNMSSQKDSSFVKTRTIGKVVRLLPCSKLTSILFVMCALTFLLLFLITVYTSSSCPAIPLLHLFGIKKCVRLCTELIQDMNRVTNTEWNFHKKEQEDRMLLSMFTTFEPGMEKRKAYRNMFKNWKQLGPKLQTSFFYEKNSSAIMAGKFNWRAFPVPKIACGNPVLRSMFLKILQTDKSIFYGFGNADILFNDGLVKTLEAILKSDLFDKGPVVVVGRRQDVFISNQGDPLVDSTFQVEKLGRKARMSHAMAGDFFITNELFLWNHVPDLALGRMLLDNWLVWFARVSGSKVIDVTATVLALHQRELGFKPHHRMCNDDIARKSHLLPEVPIWTGSIECAGYVTQFTSDGDIFITPKIDLPYYCYDGSILQNEG